MIWSKFGYFLCQTATKIGSWLPGNLGYFFATFKIWQKTSLKQVLNEFEHNLATFCSTFLETLNSCLTCLCFVLIELKSESNTRRRLQAQCITKSMKCADVNTRNETRWHSEIKTNILFDELRKKGFFIVSRVVKQSKVLVS